MCCSGLKSLVSAPSSSDTPSLVPGCCLRRPVKKISFSCGGGFFPRMGFPGNPVVEEMRSPPPPGRGGVTKRMDALHGCGGKKEVGINSWRSVGHENRSPHRHFLAPPPHVTHEEKKPIMGETFGIPPPTKTPGKKLGNLPSWASFRTYAFPPHAK